MIPFILLIIPQDYAATVFAILEIFGLGNKVKALYGSEVNSLHNVITMAINLHSVFHSFNLWLEPVLGWVCCIIYSIILHSSYMVYSGKHLWLLRETTWPVPSAHPITHHVQRRTLCRRCRQGCWASWSDLEDITVLADDGSMAELLSSRLSTSTPWFVDVRG